MVNISKDGNILDVHSHSSKGNQLKIRYNNTWYKADFLGYEGAAEHITSTVLEHSNITCFVSYFPEKFIYKKKEYLGCVSSDFLSEKYKLITSERLFQSETGKSVWDTIEKLSTRDRIKTFVEIIESITRLEDFGAYLTTMLEIDEFVLNEDRHFHNITFLQDTNNNKYRLCPYFDFGASFLSDLRDYPLEKNTVQLVDSVTAKPFNSSFKKQTEISEELYGKHLKFSPIDVAKVKRVIESYYSKRIAERIIEVYKWQSLRFKEKYFEIG